MQVRNSGIFIHMTNQFAVLSLCCLAFFAGCRRERSAGPVAVTNTFLQCVVQELLGPDERVLRLCEPGMCPSHVELRPSQVQDLRDCTVLLRFDFQSSMDKRMTGLCRKGLKISGISISGGICEPDSYLTACDQIADSLVAAGLLDRAAADSRLGEIRTRITDFTDNCGERVKELKGAAVLASEHQAKFCRWLGLDVAATFTSVDTALVGRLDKAVAAAESAGVRFVIANLPEGRSLADSLADRLNARVVVFGNFPDQDAEGNISYLGLLNDNIDALIRASGD